MERRIISLDPGNVISGIVVLDGMQIKKACNATNEDVFNIIGNYCIHRDVTIVCEDIKPYALKLNQEVIDTCKFIGELTYRLRVESGLNLALVSRYDVKKWVYDSFPDISHHLVDKKIDSKLFNACVLNTRQGVRLDSDGRPGRKGSFIYVDDVIVREAMKKMYNIPLPPAGKGYLYGLQTHSWQALGAASYFMTKLGVL